RSAFHPPLPCPPEPAGDHQYAEGEDDAEHRTRDKQPTQRQVVDRLVERGRMHDVAVLHDGIDGHRGAGTDEQQSEQDHRTHLSGRTTVTQPTYPHGDGVTPDPDDPCSAYSV